MGLVDEPGSRRLGRRIDLEDDVDRFAPVSAFGDRVEQSPIGAVMALVICRYLRFGGRSVVKRSADHHLAFEPGRGRDREAPGVVGAEELLSFMAHKSCAVGGWVATEFLGDQ